MTNNTITSITQLQKEVFFLEKWRFKVEFGNEKHDVTVTADVERNDAFEDKDGTTAFVVNIYYRVDDYLLQEHEIGLFFGSKDMSPDEIEETAHVLASRFVNNQFLEEEALASRITAYLKNMEYLEQEWTEAMIAKTTDCDSTDHNHTDS